MSYSEDLIKDLTRKTESKGSNSSFSIVAHGTIGTSVEIVAASTTTKGVIITNATTGAIYIKLGGDTVSASSYSVRITKDTMWEAPYFFQGSITAIIEGSKTGSTFVTIIK
tara:strand:- start:18568 stop:18900 length:333 start_codon:yes stop_codon:yes gene_type:complete